MSQGKCLTCGDMFTVNSHGHKYCRRKCRPSVAEQPSTPPTPRKLFHEERVCNECGETYIAKAVNQKRCNAACLHVQYRRDLDQKKEERRQERQAERELLETRLWQIPRDLRLANEGEFTEWFAGHHILFGIREIVRLRRQFPDVVATLFNGRTVRIELEYESNNFRMHGHNPLECDIIIAYSKPPGQTNVRGVPVIALFNRHGNTSDLSPTSYFAAITEKAGDMLGAALQSPQNGCICDGEVL